MCWCLGYSVFAQFVLIFVTSLHLHLFWSRPWFRLDYAFAQFTPPPPWPWQKRSQYLGLVFLGQVSCFFFQSQKVVWYRIFGNVFFHKQGRLSRVEAPRLTLCGAAVVCGSMSSSSAVGLGAPPPCRQCSGGVMSDPVCAIYMTPWGPLCLQDSAGLKLFKDPKWQLLPSSNWSLWSSCKIG